MTLALIAGVGRLPGVLAPRAGLVCALEGFAPEGVAVDVTFRLERLGALFDVLRRAGVETVCFAGAVRRPAIDPARLDPVTAALAPRLAAAMAAGDDHTLRLVLAIFEEQGFSVRGAAEIAPALLPEPGLLGRVAPDARDEVDAARAAAVVAALGAADVGQGAVVAQGQVLAVEALPGTDWMLGSITELGTLRPDPARGRGLLLKAPKPGQDRRVDLPAVGPRTLEGAARAGLGGLVIEAGGVLLLDREAAVEAADRAGLFLWVRPAEHGG